MPRAPAIASRIHPSTQWGNNWSSFSLGQSDCCTFIMAEKWAIALLLEGGECEWSDFEKTGSSFIYINTGKCQTSLWFEDSNIMWHLSITEYVTSFSLFCQWELLLWRYNCHLFLKQCEVTYKMEACFGIWWHNYTQIHTSHTLYICCTVTMPSRMKNIRKDRGDDELTFQTFGVSRLVRTKLSGVKAPTSHVPWSNKKRGSWSSPNSTKVWSFVVWNGVWRYFWIDFWTKCRN